jgi:hypothetical protein
LDNNFRFSCSSTISIVPNRSLTNSFIKRFGVDETSSSLIADRQIRRQNQERENANQRLSRQLARQMLGKNRIVLILILICFCWFSWILRCLKQQDAQLHYYGARLVTASSEKKKKR